MNRDSGLDIALQMRREAEASVNPDVSQMPVKGNQLNDIKATSKGLGVDSSHLIAQPHLLPNAKQSLSLKNITGKSPELGMYLNEPDKQATWWDKLQDIEKYSTPFNLLHPAGVIKEVSKRLLNEDEKKHIGSSQAGRALGMADFAIQGTKTYLKETGMAKMMDNPVFKTVFNSDVNLTIQNTQDKIIETKAQMKAGLMKDPNLLVRTTDGIATALSYFGVGYLTAGQGIIPMGIAEGGGMGVEAGRDAGLSDTDQTKLGVMQGAITALSERASFGFGKYLGTSSVGQAVLRNAVARNTAKLLASGATEMAEENIEGFGHAESQQMFGIDAEFAFETDPAIFLTGMFMHAGHRIAQTAKRSQVANQLSSHIDSSIAFADKLNVNIDGAVSDMINARDKGLTLTFDAIELDVALEKDADLRARVVNLVGEQNYNDKLARGDKVEISLGDYVEYLRDGDTVLRGVAEYENTKLNATMTEEAQEKALTDLMSYADMQMFVTQTMSDGVAETATYTKLYDTFVSRMRDSGAYENRTDIQHTHADFFARLASQFTDMAQRQFDVGTDENKGEFDSVAFIKDLLPMFESGVNAGTQGRQIITAMNSMFSENRTSAEVAKGIGAKQFLASRGQSDASSNEELLKSFQALVGAGYLQDTANEADAISMTQTAIESNSLLPEGSKGLEVYQEMGSFLERLEKLGVEVNQRYTQLFESLRTSDPTMSTETLNQLLVEFNNLHGLRERQLLEAQMGGREKAIKTHADSFNEGKTELNYDLWLKVRTPRFKAWFGDWEKDPANSSKVINPRTGEPLVIYHGSEKPYTFTTFEKGFVRKTNGFFASDASQVSATYVAGSPVPLMAYPKGDEVIHHNYDANIYAGFLNIRNAGEYDFKGETWGRYEEENDYIPITTKMGSISEYFNNVPTFTDKESAYDWLLKEVQSRLVVIDNTGKFMTALDGTNAGERPNGIGIRADNGIVKFNKFVRGASVEDISGDIRNYSLGLAIDAVRLQFNVGDVTAFKTTDQLKDEDFASGRDGTIMTNVVDTADGSPIASNVFVFFESNQFKHVDNNGAYSDKGDILRQMVRDDFRQEFVEAETRMGGRDAWIKATTNLNYPDWVASHTENYKDGMPNIFNDASTLFQASEKGFGSEFFVNPVFREIMKLPPKQFGDGDSEVATAKAWLDKLKSMPVNKDFMMRTKIYETLASESYGNKEGKVSKNQIISAMGSGWGVVFDMALNNGYSANPVRFNANEDSGVYEKVSYRKWEKKNVNLPDIRENDARKDTYRRAIAGMLNIGVSKIEEVEDASALAVAYRAYLKSGSVYYSTETYVRFRHNDTDYKLSQTLPYRLVDKDGAVSFLDHDSDNDIIQRIEHDDGRTTHQPVPYIELSLADLTESQAELLDEVIKEMLPDNHVVFNDNSYSYKKVKYLLPSTEQTSEVVSEYNKRKTALPFDAKQVEKFKPESSSLLENYMSNDYSYAVARAVGEGNADLYYILDSDGFLKSKYNHSMISGLLSDVNNLEKHTYAHSIAKQLEKFGKEEWVRHFAVFEQSIVNLGLQGTLSPEERYDAIKQKAEQIGKPFYTAYAGSLIGNGYSNNLLAHHFGAQENIDLRQFILDWNEKHELIREPEMMDKDEYTQQEYSEDWDERVRSMFYDKKADQISDMESAFNDNSNERAMEWAEAVADDDFSFEIDYGDIDEPEDDGVFKVTIREEEYEISYSKDVRGDDNSESWQVDFGSGIMYLREARRLDLNRYDTFAELYEAVKDIENAMHDSARDSYINDLADGYEDSDNWYEVLGYRSEDGAWESEHDEDTVMEEMEQELEEEYQRNGKARDKAQDDVEREMQVVWESYTDSSKGYDNTLSGSFNIALRLPTMTSRFRNDSHTKISDGYEVNIIALVMGNFRDVVRPDGTVAHAMFVEEVQSDIQQGNRDYWAWKKEPEKFVRAKLENALIMHVMWDKLSSAQVEIVKTAIAVHRQMADDLIEEARQESDQESALLNVAGRVRGLTKDALRKHFSENNFDTEDKEAILNYIDTTATVGESLERAYQYLTSPDMPEFSMAQLKSMTKKFSTDIQDSGSAPDFYITQDNLPQEMIVKGIVQMMADPNFITGNKPITDVVFGSARTVSIHNQSGQYTDHIRVSISSKKISVSGAGHSSQGTTILGVASYLGNDLIPIVEGYFERALKTGNTYEVHFVRDPSPDMIGKVNDQGAFIENIGHSYDKTPVMQPTTPNNIGLINQYDKKTPKVIKSEVARLGGVVQEYRTVNDREIVDGLKLNDIPLLGYELKPTQDKFLADPDSVRASLFQRDSLIEGAYDRQRKLIQSFNNDNPTTIMHEGAHWYLDTLSTMANQLGLKEAREALVRIGEEFKFDPRIPVPVEAHERFARSFEQFLLEGKAPSSATKLTMGEMKEQFKRQYMIQKKVGNVSPEASELFSKMIDSDEASAEQMAKPLFTVENAQMLGLTEPQLNAYLRNKQIELEESAGNTRDKSMSVIEKRKSNQWKKDVKQQRESIMDEMSQQDMNYRDEKVFSYLTTGAMPNGGDVGIPHIRLSRKDTVALIGEEATASFPQNIFGTTQGIPPISPEDDMLLTMFGYGNAQELFDSIEQGMGYKQRVQAQAEAMADQLANEESASMKAMAEAGAHHSKRAMNLKLEIDILSRYMNTKPPSMPTIASAVAFEVQNMTLEQITKQRNRVLKAERKAGDEALKFMSKGNIPAVISEKIKELTNAVMFDQMLKAQEKGNKQSKWIQDKAKPKSYTKIGKGGAVYVDAYESVLSYIGLTDKAKTKVMASVVKELTNNGEIVQATEELIDAISSGDVKFLDQMSVAEVSELYDLFKNIRSMSSQASTMTINEKAVEMEFITTEIARNAFDNLTGKPVPLDPETMSVLEKSNSFRKQAVADLYRLEAVSGWIDGEDAGGMFTSAIWQPFTKASDGKNAILRELLEPLASMSEKLIKDIGKSAMRKEHTMPWADQNGAPVKVTRQWMISFALNTGNASSLERLGNQFDQTQINHVLSELTKPELEYVQNVWDLIETLWTRIETLERKMSGVSPVKVERVPRIIRLNSGGVVKLAGGYFPIVYDKDSPQYIDTFGNDADQLLSKGVMPASTSHGFTKSRAKTVNIPLKFDLTKIMGHIEEVAHDLSHREAVKNAWRIMNSKMVKEAFVGTGNLAMYNMIRAKIKQIAQSDSMDVQGLTAMKKLSRHLRSGISASAMGLSTVTMTKQVIGLSQGIARLGLASDSSVNGFKYMAVGIADSLSRGHREQAIAESGLMQNRIDTVNLDVRRQMTRRMGRTMSLGLVSDMASPLLWLKDRAFVPMAWVQFNFVDMPVYLGAKRLGARQGLQGDALVRFAEQAVRRSQGAGETKDTALIENVAFLELFIPFYSYASAYLNEQVSILKKARKYKQAKRLMIEAPTIATATVMLVMTPMILDTMISFGLGKMDLPDEDDDEEYWVTLMKYFSVKFTFDAMTYGIPIVRDVGAMTARAINDEPQFSNPRGMDVVAGNLQKLYKHAGDAVSEDEEVDGTKLAKDVVTTTTVLTGIPLNKPYAHLDSYLYELENGDGEFGSAEFWLNFYGGSRNDREE